VSATGARVLATLLRLVEAQQGEGAQPAAICITAR